ILSSRIPRGGELDELVEAPERVELLPLGVAPRAQEPVAAVATGLQLVQYRRGVERLVDDGERAVWDMRPEPFRTSSALRRCTGQTSPPRARERGAP